MKRTFLLGICMAAMAWLCTACTDKCEQTTTYRYQKAYYVTTAELRSSIASLAPQVLSDPGKIYANDNYLFINEKKKGIHIIDNSNPSSPTFVSFINIPGNTDIAVKGNILYADSYVDFLAIDITDPKNIKVVSRTEDAFPSGSIDGTHWQYDFTQKTIIDYRWETVTQTYTTDCDGAGYPIAYANDMSYYSKAGAATAGGSTSTTGTGGSMARFAIANDYLYAVTNSDMQLFNIQKPEKPSKGNLVNLGWGIETIFPYNNLLFVGTTTGMQILDNTNPVKPEHLSTVSHVMSCDPVVVDGKYAYVTLHTGDSWCRNGVNQLDVINIENPRSPTVIKSYSMKNPHGLGIDNQTLFVCEGAYGLKVFDAKDVTALDKNQLAFFEKINTYDVIPLKGTLMMIGSDGLYQYDYKDPKNLKLLSVIPVKK